MSNENPPYALSDSWIRKNEIAMAAIQNPADWQKCGAAIVRELNGLWSICQSLLEVTSCRAMSFCGGRGAVQAPVFGCDCCVCEAARAALSAASPAKTEKGKA